MEWFLGILLIKLKISLRLKNFLDGKDTPQKIMFLEQDLNCRPLDRQAEMPLSSCQNFL